MSPQLQWPSGAVSGVPFEAGRLCSVPLDARVFQEHVSPKNITLIPPPLLWLI